MTAPVELVPLRCLRCETPVPAQPDEVAWVCAQCGQGLLLYQDQELVPLNIQFMAAIPTGKRGKPYWVAEAQVEIERSTYGGSGRTLDEAERFWGEKRVFYIPAFTCTLDESLAYTTQLLSNPPGLQPGPPVSFEPVSLSPGDVTALAEFAALSIEAARKDSLKNVSVKIRLVNSPNLWILP